MTNGDSIRSMNDAQLANFLNISRPDCSDICKDAGIGCAATCKWQCGYIKYLEWLKQEVKG